MLFSVGIDRPRVVRCGTAQVLTWIQKDLIVSSEAEVIVEKKKTNVPSKKCILKIL